MWCTNCRTGFDWRSLGVVHGIVHNPHYQQYLETIGAPSGSGAPLPPQDVIRTHLRLNVPDKCDSCMAVYRLVAGCREEIATLPSLGDTVCNRDLRAAYLTNELTEEKFKETLQRRAKELEKKLEYREIVEAYLAISEELIQRMVRTVDVAPLLAEEKRVRTYLNAQISELGKRYDAVFRPIAH